MIQFPQPWAPTAVFVADDADEAWDELGPHLLHDAKTAASYRPHDNSVASITRADSVAELREDSGPYRIFTPDEAIDYVRGGQLLPLHPLCVGVAPAVAWPYLERAAAAFARVHEATGPRE
jgi:hypothetical protein